MSNQASRRDPDDGPLHAEMTGAAQTLLAFMETPYVKHHGGFPIYHADLFQGRLTVHDLYVYLTGTSPEGQLTARRDASTVTSEVSRGS